MTKRLLSALLIIVVTLPAAADFAEVARALDRKDGVKRIWIPLLGLARFAVRVVQPEGVNDFQLATFEGTINVDPRELQQMMREKLGAGFRPLVQVWSRKSGRKEWSCIYVRPRGNGDNVEVVILAQDNEDTVLVRVDVDARILARHLNEPRSVRHMAHR